MTTATRIITTEDRGYSILADNDINVLTGKHDYKDERNLSVLRNDSGVSISASDSMDHAIIWMSREEARMFAHAILEATA